MSDHEDCIYIADFDRVVGERDALRAALARAQKDKQMAEERLALTSMQRDGIYADLARARGLLEEWERWMSKGAVDDLPYADTRAFLAAGGPPEQPIPYEEARRRLFPEDYARPAVLCADDEDCACEVSCFDCICEANMLELFGHRPSCKVGQR